MARDSKPCVHGLDNANDPKLKFDSYLHLQVPDTYHETNPTRVSFRNETCVNIISLHNKNI